MRFTLGVLLLGLLVATQSSALAQEKKAGAKDPIANTRVTSIQKYRDRGEQKLKDNTLTRKEIPLTGENVRESIKQKWEKMAAYYQGDTLVLIQLYPHQGISERTEEFYVMDNELVFAFIQDKGPKHEGTDLGEPGKEFYFDHGKLLKYENRSGEKAANPTAERRMYEATLPYEASELLAVLKDAK